jgi:hypothetical protein
MLMIDYRQRRCELARRLASPLPHETETLPLDCEQPTGRTGEVGSARAAVMRHRRHARSDAAGQFASPREHTGT